jgi:hypothetical protein
LNDELPTQPPSKLDVLPCLFSALEASDGLLGVNALAEASVTPMDKKSRMDDSDASSLTSRRNMSRGSSKSLACRVNLARHFSDGGGVHGACSNAGRDVDEDSQSAEDASRSCRILDMVRNARCDCREDDDMDNVVLVENEGSVSRRLPSWTSRPPSWSELSLVV